jgi:P-type Cu2+ transporter
MACCTGADLAASEQANIARREELKAAAQGDDVGRPRLTLSVPDIRCGQCIAAIERALRKLPEVASARVNLSTRRVSVTLAAQETDPVPVVEALEALGYPATAVEPGTSAASGSTARQRLLRAMAVAGFGASNVMLMSVAVWSGAGPDQREAFHLLSAVIALPVAAYAGQPFFASAATGLRAGRLNMDVPISLGILLTLGLSLFESVRGGEHVFFDAALTLLFFLLVGRYFDAVMRERASSAITGLARIAARGGTVLYPGGGRLYLPLDQIRPSAILAILPGDRVPVDVRIRRGSTDVDRSIVTGESAPVPAGPGDALEAGSLNLTGAVEAEVLRPAGESFLAEVTRMLEAAEGGRGRYVRLADRVARLYAPIVHLLAAATFVGWLVVTGGDWHAAIFAAVSVLIITCPCALGLAVPVVHVVASGSLFRAGIMVRDGSALERIASVTRAVFDKTGTLTTGNPQVAIGSIDPAERCAVKALAQLSTHPVARALAAALDADPAAVGSVRERPGYGVEGTVAGRRARLGRASWVAEIASETPPATGTAFAFADGPLTGIGFGEALRPLARETVERLRRAGVAAEVVSGDAAAAVEAVASAAGIESWQSGCTPAEKVAHLESLAARGERVLMIGDGLNDAAALAVAHVSMAPATASDVGRMAADLVFTRPGLDAVALAQETARRAARLVRQNLAMAILYNFIAVPVAVAGLVTPLVAAVAMSASSILVVGNALRLNATGEALRPIRPASLRARLA